MQERELNCATIGVGNRTDISRRATADEMNRGLRAGKGKSLWHIAWSTFLSSVTVAGFFITLAPLAANADDDKDRRGDNDKEIRTKIAALQAQVADLQSLVGTLQTNNTSLQGQVTTLQNQLANAKNVLALDPFVSVDPNPEIGVIGPNITFKGANIHIVSGSGSTDDNGNRTGLGNLIIGYGESKPPVPAFPILGPGDRRGSHNLVIGRWNRFTQAAFGGFVAGEANFTANEGASVSGGLPTPLAATWLV